MYNIGAKGHVIRLNNILSNFALMQSQRFFEAEFQCVPKKLLIQDVCNANKKVTLSLTLKKM